MKKVILITGASSGMGKDFAIELLKDGHTVYGAARRVDKMADLQALGVKVMAMDVTNDESMVNGINTIIANEGRIDVLINNAGFGSYGAIEEVSMDDARYQLEVNVIGAARLMQLVLPHMRKQHFGRIINISSIAGKFSTPLGGWYHASKHALEALSDSVRNEVKQFGIDVIIIEPGGVKSEWADIAMDNAIKVSGNGAYQNMANRFAQMGKQQGHRMSDPKVITRLIKHAIASKKPKTRYSGGFMAKPILFLRSLLPDRVFDKLLMSQLK